MKRTSAVVRQKAHPLGMRWAIVGPRSGVDCFENWESRVGLLCKRVPIKFEILGTPRGPTDCLVSLIGHGRRLLD